MVMDKVNPLRRNRAVTLIEAVLDAVSQDDGKRCPDPTFLVNL